MNIFMQFIYCFLFLIYLAFLPSGGGWAVSLIWAMMILPLASTIQNSLQDLTSRICGIDTNAQATQAFAMGGVAGGAIGYGIYRTAQIYSNKQEASIYLCILIPILAM